MHIAIPRPYLADEQRVALTPAGVAALIDDGHTVYVESGAGVGAGFADSAFGDVGATIIFSRDEIIARGSLLVTVNGLAEADLPYLRRGQTLCGFLPLAAMPRRALDALCATGISTLSYDMICGDDGARPVLLPMSEIAGRLLPQITGRLLETPSGGRGTLLAPIPGVPSAEVVILGAGIIGVNAAYGLTAVGVQTTVLDHDIERLRFCERICRGRVTTRMSTPSAIEHVLPFADVLIGAVHEPTGRAPMLVSRALVGAMKPRSVIVDVSIDEGGCVETSRPTSHANPTYLAEGVLHYAVPNIPSAVARTAAHALNNALLPYVAAIAGLGLERAAAANAALARGIGLVGGRPASPRVAALFGHTTSQTTPTQMEPL
jgi:alanine dehydrogenase